jgi:hypothetical protein
LTVDIPCGLFENAICFLEAISKLNFRYERLQFTLAALSAEKVLDVLQHTSEPFSPPALTTDFSLDLPDRETSGTNR